MFSLRCYLTVMLYHGNVISRGLPMSTGFAPSWSPVIFASTDYVPVVYDSFWATGEDRSPYFQGMDYDVDPAKMALTAAQ